MWLKINTGRALTLARLLHYIIDIKKLLYKKMMLIFVYYALEFVTVRIGLIVYLLATSGNGKTITKTTKTD